jgi:cobalt/nickel transport system ATP-binding protein
MAEPLFSLNNVSFSYRDSIPALRDLTMSIEKGERTAIIGANGTGKSTLLSMLDALVFPQKGAFRYRGKEITERRMNDAAIQREFRKSIGYVFQNPDIQLFCPTVREDIVFGPLQLGVSKEETLRRFERVVEIMRLTHLIDRSTHHLSIGEKKKVAIASVLVIEPDVLLLDEPTAGLDPQTMRDIIAVLQEAHQAGKTVIMATHDLHIVEEIADRIHVFGSDRSIIRSGTPEEILGDRDFLQKNNLVHIHVHRHFHASHVHEH